MQPIRSRYADDPDMLEIVREFAQELPERAASLDALLKAERLSELQTAAHQLKGSGGGYGFPEITECAARLEQALKDGAPAPQLAEHTRALVDTLHAVQVPEDA